MVGRSGSYIAMMVAVTSAKPERYLTYSEYQISRTGRALTADGYACSKKK
jgi:hypothetical protein